MQNLTEFLKHLDVSVIRYLLVKAAAYEIRMLDFLLWWLFSTHCNAATLGSACRVSYPTISPALGHSYPKPISRKLQKGRQCLTQCLQSLLEMEVGTTLLWEMSFSKAETASPAWSLCCSTLASDPPISLDLCPGSLSALFFASFKPVPALAVWLHLLHACFVCQTLCPASPTANLSDLCYSLYWPHAQSLNLSFTVSSPIIRVSLA